MASVLSSRLGCVPSSAGQLRPRTHAQRTSICSSSSRREGAACSPTARATAAKSRASPPSFTTERGHQLSHTCLQRNPTPSEDAPPSRFLDDVTSSTISVLPALAVASPILALSLLLPCPPASADVIFTLAADDFSSGSYSQASYYTSLALFIISIPGLWSLIKRATKSKIVRRTFLVPGPAAAAETGGRTMKQLAGEITSSLGRSNYRVSDAKDVVTFEGDIIPSRSQAAFLVFCTALSLASVALVLSITNPDVGEWWYSITLLSPLAGVYYWKKAARKEQIQVKIVISDDERTADVTIQGDDEEIERLRRELGLMEKGLEYVKGILEG